MKININIRLLIIMLCAVLFVPCSKAQETNETPQHDSLEVSLLTCSPGQLAYAMFGHSAIRVHNLTTRQDISFNYGMFNYQENNFVFKFVKGETDYVLGAESADGFFWRYGEKGDGIHEQVLNLTQEECRRIYELLIENLRPENRTYRYNWLYDNCTTRARDMIERAVDGEVVYTNPDQHKSAREILHEFSFANPWVEVGEDLVLGYEIDKTLTKRQQMFIPSYYQKDLETAEIHRKDGSVVPLVREERQPLVMARTIEHPFSQPLLLIWVLLAVVAVVSFFEIRRRKTYKWVDVILQLSQGILGFIIAFLFFFSEHAGVSTNLIVLLLNPLAFVFIPFFIMRRVKNVSYIILAEILLFILTTIVFRQCYNAAFYVLVLILLLRDAVNIFVCRTNSLSLQTNSDENKK